MGGICMCPACGEFYYGDERDDWQTCSCTPPTPPERVAEYRAEYERSIARDEAWERYFAGDGPCPEENDAHSTP